MTIDEAIAICKMLIPDHPELSRVIGRIEELRDERDNLHRLARKAISDIAWERSDTKKRADSLTAGKGE